MKRFAALFTALDQTTKTTVKGDALAAYLPLPEPGQAASIRAAVSVSVPTGDARPPNSVPNA